MSIAVRRITPEDWREVKALRLQALADPAAPMAFLDTVEHAAAQPDRFWQERAANASGDAAAAQFVAIADDGTWTGTITLLPHREQHDAGLVVGVYVADAHRGAGVIDALLDAAAAWARDRGLRALVLEVHVDNSRAQAVYRRAGFVPTGEIETSGFGREWVMRRELADTGSVPA
ncbi:GNAT family N-acetyltransferase [Microbacterium sp. NRRL B-14842]|uniref:GNAT family N-acetyltransferase n=1 Tax=unclassified Microbacterium TaxID=2609290 RepID=UPI001656AB1E|nr:MULTISPECIES: GNAT family N-acetyltransferase [unclassified Microbacterium]MCT1365604.1 GNAT family N-acetyltransferase [Microbacterium sp. p3-SID131]MCT1376710.1 GNAT family N-acetyltransferase [Microbacterium sp. p3-SID337]CAD5139202.1 N-acetyltransferase domain-containing protein [Microbacterium sp. Nx66]